LNLLSGVQHIVIGDEEGLMHITLVLAICYDVVLAAYKGELKMWFVANKSLDMYFVSISMNVILWIFWRKVRRLHKLI